MNYESWRAIGIMAFALFWYGIFVRKIMPLERGHKSKPITPSLILTRSEAEKLGMKIPDDVIEVHVYGGERGGE